MEKVLKRPDNELNLEDMPHPPLFKLVDGSGADASSQAEIGGEPATLGALFASRELAEEFSESAAEFGLQELANRIVVELPDQGSVAAYAAAREEYILVVAENGTGLFFADDVARYFSEAAGDVGEMREPSFPLYLFSDERGEAPLISVEDENGPLLVAALFTSPDKARNFRERAIHLDLPDHLGTIEDADGLSRHALIARQAGAGYAVIDPEPGMTEAIPLEDFIPR